MKRTSIPASRPLSSHAPRKLACTDAWVVDAVGRWPIKGRLSLDLRAENLFDARVVTSILADGTRERGTPRTLWIGLRLD